MQPLGQSPWEGRSTRQKRKSGDRPGDSLGVVWPRWEGRRAFGVSHSDTVDEPLFIPATLRKNRMPDRSRKAVTLVLGGVRSGKSRYGQTLAERAGSVGFIATAQPVDDEMRRKIDRHRADRSAAWPTFEEPVAIDRIVRDQSPHFDLLLIDCLTLYVSNLMTKAAGDLAAVDTHVDNLCAAIEAASCSVVMISNEVGSGIVPAFASGRLFRDLLGETNQRMARLSDDVIFMVAGLPSPLKGALA
jgi:adenosylcobinamide kinase/adenosylcobinamide-phosphate guanylyltransferase